MTTTARTLTQDYFPPLLRAARDRPSTLYVRGHLRASHRYIAVVGTRSPTTFGADVVHAIVPLLVAEGWTIVSGLAKGIDAIAHREALRCGGHTVAVLANGLDTVYPREHGALAEAILDAGGALVSEHAPHVTVTPQRLVARNRIQSGLGAATLVCQAGAQSGTMHTVRFAQMQGRLVVAPSVPWPGDEHGVNGGLVALALDGPSFAARVGAGGAYAALLRERFATTPVARIVTGQADHVALINELAMLADEWRSRV